MNEIVDLLQSLIGQAAEMSDQFSEQEMQQIIQIFTQAIELVTQAEGQLPETPENLPSAEYPSSQINGFRFDPKSGKLTVQFHGKYPVAEGPIYEYDNVPPWIFDIFRRGAVGPKTSGANGFHRWEKNKMPSYGAAMNALIKAGGYNYRKLS